MPRQQRRIFLHGKSFELGNSKEIHLEFLRGDNGGTWEREL
jgi:hypothetical protein